MVPSTVMAGPPAERTVPAMGKADGLGVKVWPATVYTLLEGGSDRLGRSIVELPITRAPDGSRLMRVPSILTAGPPAETVVPATGNAEGFGVNVWPATV